MKKCKKCNLEKPKDEFYKHPSNKDGLQSWCKECVRERASTHRKSNLEYYSNYHKEYNLNYINRAKNILRKIKTRSKIKNAEFNLPLERIVEAFENGVCERTGIPFDFSSPTETHFNFFAPSIDKKNPFGDYTIENVQIVCNAYNFGKGQMTDNEFIDFCRKVIEYDDKQKRGNQ